MSLSSDKKITLKSSDGETFEVDQMVALESQPIKHMVEDDYADSVIPLPNVTSTILSKVIEYCKKHVEGREKKDDKSSEDELKKWDADFVNVDHKTLFDLIMAANYLHIKGLLDLTCQTVADMMKGKDPEEVRKLLNITREEEEEVRRKNQWAFTAMGNDIFGRRRRHWNETAKIWLIIFGIGMYIVLYVIQFVRVLYRIIYLYE